MYHLSMYHLTLPTPHAKQHLSHKTKADLIIFRPQAILSFRDSFRFFFAPSQIAKNIEAFLKFKLSLSPTIVFRTEKILLHKSALQRKKIHFQLSRSFALSRETKRKKRKKGGSGEKGNAWASDGKSGEAQNVK